MQNFEKISTVISKYIPLRHICNRIITPSNPLMNTDSHLKIDLEKEKGLYKRLHAHLPMTYINQRNLSNARIENGVGTCIS